MTVRRFVLGVLLATTLLFPALAVNAHAENRGTDVFGQLFGPDRFGDSAWKYPTSRYQLDTHIDGGGITDPGQSVSSAPARVGDWVTNFLWTLALFFRKIVSALFAWAFSVDFLTGNHGVLRPVAEGARAMYQNVFGGGVLIAAIAVAGVWAGWKAIGGRYKDATIGLGMSVVLAAGVLWLMSDTERVIGDAYAVVQTASASLLAGTTKGTANPEAAQRKANGHLTETFVHAPWMMLNFGGFRHCVDTDDLDKDGYPTPISDPDDPRVDVCRSNERYARAYLAHPPDSEARNDEYEKIKDGRIPYDKADSPAVDIQQQGQVLWRLVVAALVAYGSWKMAKLLGRLSIIVILAAVLLVAFVAFAPVMAVLAFLPGRGHGIVAKWAGYLTVTLLLKVLYSLVIGVLLMISIAVTGAAGVVMPAGTAFLVTAAIWIGADKYWGVMLKSIGEAKMTYGAHDRLSYGAGVIQQAATQPTQLLRHGPPPVERRDVHEGRIPPDEAPARSNGSRPHTDTPGRQPAGV